MAFFDSLAGSIVNFIVGSWDFMRHIAGVVVNSTFGWYSGVPIDENIAAIMIYGGGTAILVAVIFFKKALKVR